jgi:hypothetical protein
MPRRLKLATKEIANLELQLIYSYAGVWETDWLPLQGSFLADSFTMVSKADMDHALCGWTMPLVRSLGVSPLGSLHKLPAKAKKCASLKLCPHSGAECHPTAKKTPWCFYPAGIDQESSYLAIQVIQLWREGVYIVIVEES